jgi:hypothetical protein
VVEGRRGGDGAVLPYLHVPIPDIAGVSDMCWVWVVVAGDLSIDLKKKKKKKK